MKKRKPYERHGHAGNGKMSSTYRSWRMMVNRCHNPNAEDYEYYGGRGIVVCDRWRESFQSFVDDMGERPVGLTVDRYPDKSGNYEPDNCRWATDLQQGRNTLRNRLIVFNGETQPLSVWCQRYGVEQSVARQRLDKLKWPFEAAFELEHNWQYRARNVRAVRIGDFIGSISEWCEALKLNKNTIQSRITKQGMTPQKALGY